MRGGHANPDREESFGGRLRRLRLERGLSAVSVATSLGVSAQAVCAWETGGARPKPRRLVRLAALLGVRPRDLVHTAGKATLVEAVRRTREEIAELAGVPSRHVKIIVEM